MASFRYQALNAAQKPVAGEISADNVQQAIAQLEASGLSVQSIGYAALEPPSAAARGSVPAGLARIGDEHAVLRSHLARVIEGGKPIAPALRAYAEEMPWGRQRLELQTLVQVLERGDAAEAEQAFATLPEYWIPLLSAAGSSHDPARVLNEFLEESRRADELRRQWWLTLAYPLMVVCLAAAVVIALSFLVIPGFREIFNDFGLQLPGLTRLVLSLSSWINSGWFMIVVLLVAAVGAIVLFARRLSPAPTRTWLGDWFRVPFGRSTAIARLARYTADLLEAGLTVPDALRIAGFSNNRAGMRRAAWRLANDMESGVFAARQIDRPPVTATVLHALNAEMPSASRIRLLREISQAHAERAGVRLSWTRGIIEPLAICVVGLVVGLVVLGLFLPLVKLIEGLSS